MAIPPRVIVVESEICVLMSMLVCFRTISGTIRNDKKMSTVQVFDQMEIHTKKANVIIEIMIVPGLLKEKVGDSTR